MQVLTPESSRTSVGPVAFRNAMRHLAGAVSIVTAGSGVTRTGMTATSVTSLSAEPPTLLVCVNRSSSSFAVLNVEQYFGVSVLAADQRGIGDRFSGNGGVKGLDRYVDAEWTTLLTGTPILLDALLTLDCEVEERIVHHTHTIIIGRIHAVRFNEHADALVYWRGRYVPLAEH